MAVSNSTEVTYPSKLECPGIFRASSTFDLIDGAPATASIYSFNESVADFSKLNPQSWSTLALLDGAPVVASAAFIKRMNQNAADFFAGSIPQVDDTLCSPWPSQLRSTEEYPIESVSALWCWLLSAVEDCEKTVNRKSDRKATVATQTCECSILWWGNAVFRWWIKIETFRDDRPDFPRRRLIVMYIPLEWYFLS